MSGNKRWHCTLRMPKAAPVIATVLFARFFMVVLYLLIFFSRVSMPFPHEEYPCILRCEDMTGCKRTASHITLEKNPGQICSLPLSAPFSVLVTTCSAEVAQKPGRTDTFGLPNCCDLRIGVLEKNGYTMEVRIPCFLISPCSAIANARTPNFDIE